jgi:hypothetical protein
LPSTVIRAGFRVNQAEQRLGQRCAAAAQQAGDAQHLALAQRETDIAERARLVERVDLQQGFAGALEAAGRGVIQVTAGHVAGQRCRVEGFGGALGHVPTIAQNHHLFADLQHLGKLVADENHRDALVFQPPDDAHQRAHLFLGQRGGRLIHDDEPRRAGQRPADRHKLLVGDRQAFHPRVQRDVDTNAVQHVPRGPARRPAIVEPAMRDQFAGKGDVFGHRQVREQRKVLKDHHHPSGGCLARIEPGHRLATNADGAARWLFDARQDLDQRGLSRPVLARKADRFARLDRESHVVKRGDAGIMLGDPGHFDKGAGRGRGHDCPVVESVSSERGDRRTAAPRSADQNG